MRRKFLTTAAVLTAGIASKAMALHNNKTKKQLVHHVFFWLKNPSSLEDKNKLIEGLQTLSAISIIQKFHIGTPASTEKRDVVDVSWSVSELMMFDSVEDQATYQSHPVHLEFIKNYSHLWTKVVVYDVAEV